MCLFHLLMFVKIEGSRDAIKSISFKDLLDAKLIEN